MSQLLDELNLILQEKQNKIIPENIKKGIQIFDITGTYEGNSGGVKLFETEEQMQQDPNANEGDLAVVYREEISNMLVDTQAQYITFPETVTLPNAITESYYCMLRAVDTSTMFDGQIMLDQNMFDFNGYTENGMIRIRYESEDGINYTRTRFEGDNGDLTNPIDFGTTIQVYMPEEWNDNFGYFMQVGGNTFEGLYSFSPFNTGELELFDISKTQTTSNKIIPVYTYTESISIKIIQEIVSLLKTKYNANSGLGFTLSFDPSTNIAYIYARVIDRTSYLEFQACNHIFTTNNSKYVLAYTSTIDKYKRYDYDLTKKSITENAVSAAITVDSTYSGIPLLGTLVCDCASASVRFSNYPVFSIKENGSTIDSVIAAAKYHMINQYNIAPTQLTLSSSNELLPGKVAYGRNGIVIGDNTLYNNLNNDTLTNILFDDISDLPNLFLLSTTNRQYEASNLVLKLVADITKSGDILCGKELAGKLIPSNCTTFLYSLDKKVFYCGGFNVVTADLNAKTIDLNNYEEQAKGLGCNFNDYISFSYLDKVNNIIYGYFNTTDWDLIKLYKIENNTMYAISDEINTQVSSLITFTYRIIGYDNINKLLYILKAANASTNSEIITINEANEINSSTTINTYSTRISAFETQNYIWYSVSDYDDVNKGIRYLRKGTNNWTYLDIPYYEASYGFELDNGNIIISTYSSKSSNSKSIEINLNTSQIINESSAKCLSYNNYISRDLDGNLYTYQEMYTSNGIFVKELLSYGYADLSLDIPIIFLPNGVSNSNFNSSIAEGYYIKNQTPFNSSEGILYKYYKNNWKQLNDYNFSSLKAKE